MRISDWSSDECSSDLDEFPEYAQNVLANPGSLLDFLEKRRHLIEIDSNAERLLSSALGALPSNLRRRLDRKSVVEGTSGSGRVDLGRRLIHDKQHYDRRGRDVS